MHILYMLMKMLQYNLDMFVNGEVGQRLDGQ